MSLKLLFFGNSVFFRTLRLVLISAKSTTKMPVLTVGSFSVFGEISEIHVNYQSDLAFWGFSSFLFSLYILLIFQGLSADAPPPGPHGGGGGGPHGSGGPAPRPHGGRGAYCLFPISILLSVYCLLPVAYRSLRTGGSAPTPTP